MVNSRCVFGSSNGIRQFSANISRYQLTKTNSTGVTAVPILTENAPLNRFAICNDSKTLARTKTQKNRVGSDKQANVTSRVTPIPSNADPVSKADNTIKNLPKARRYTNSKTSPVNEQGAQLCPSGINIAAIKIVIKLTTGPNRKSHVVVLLCTVPFCSNRQTS